MQNSLFEYIPQSAKPLIQDLINTDNLVVKIRGERKTRHGDYTKLPNGKHQITVNSNLNPFRFLITLILTTRLSVLIKSWISGFADCGIYSKSVFCINTIC